jgi:hypothetical protein
MFSRRTANKIIALNILTVTWILRGNITDHEGKCSKNLWLKLIGNQQPMLHLVIRIFLKNNQKFTETT